MYPLLAIAAAKLGSNIINNVAANVADNAKATSESNAAKKAAFDQMMAKVAASPKAKNTDFLRGEGITSRADAESALHQISQKILQSPEVSAITGGVMLALGRAMGETMAVTMLIGNSNNFSLSLLAPANTISSMLANQFGEADGLQVSALMYAALVLMLLTLVVNVLAQQVVRRFSLKY